jgi:ribosomal protein S18 acetylase RimI-like enzyme
VTIHIYNGRRAALLPLFRLADESDSEIASYFELGDVLAAYDTAAVVGLAHLVEEDGFLQIVSLAVATKWQGAGLGSRLISEAVRFAQARGINRVVVCTGAWETENIIFYLNRGFRIFNVVRDFFSIEKGYAEGRRDQVQLEMVRITS